MTQMKAFMTPWLDPDDFAFLRFLGWWNKHNALPCLLRQTQGLSWLSFTKSLEMHKQSHPRFYIVEALCSATRPSWYDHGDNRESVKRSVLNTFLLVQGFRCLGAAKRAASKEAKGFFGALKLAFMLQLCSRKQRGGGYAPLPKPQGWGPTPSTWTPFPTS